MNSKEILNNSLQLQHLVDGIYLSFGAINCIIFYFNTLNPIKNYFLSGKGVTYGSKIK
jgi:hypothetical protein